jgi:hypothetical protein
MSPVHFSVMAHHNGVTLWHCRQEIMNEFKFSNAHAMFAIGDRIVHQDRTQTIIQINDDRVVLAG